LTNGSGRRHTPAARPSERVEARRERHARLVVAAREHDDGDALEALVCEHLALVRTIARRFGRDADQRDDLVQEGVVGLLKAIRRFDPGRNVPFPAYATTAVTGEIRHHLRDRASCVRAPESAVAEVVPLEDDVPTAASDFGRSEARVELGQRLSCLGPREREVVYLRFFADLTQDEIARRVGISQMHVSRLLRRALEQMREVLP
jgi:RNA polymerase sigma-B factor